MMKKTISGIAVAGILLTVSALPAQATVSTNNHATLDGGSAYIRNEWVQGGLKPNGSFGTFNPVPANFDSLFESQEGGLGLINDFGEDGFTTDDNGDFFLPGTPYEGWGIKVDGNISVMNREGDDGDGMGATGIPGSWTGSETTGDPSVTWTSDSDVDGIEITQNVSAPVAGDHLLHVTVSLHNITGAAHTVYYARQVDPDNNKDSEGDYDTFNRVISNTSSSQIVTGTAYYPTWSTIGYRSTDPTGVVRISDWSWPLGWDDDADEIVAISKEETDAALASFGSDYLAGFQDYTDSTIDIAFRKVIAAGATATVEFDYILDPREADVPELALDLSVDLSVGSSYDGADTDLSGGGLMPNSTYTLTEFSTPVVIFSGTTLPNGNFYDSTALPNDCRPGSHHLVLSGISPSGATVSDYVAYTVDADCIVTSFDPYAGAAGDWNGLAETGFDVSPWITASGLIAALGGTATVIARRRKVQH